MKATVDNLLAIYFIGDLTSGRTCHSKEGPQLPSRTNYKGLLISKQLESSAPICFCSVCAIHQNSHVLIPFGRKLRAHALSHSDLVGVWQADKYGVPRMCFVNKMDRTGANFYRAVQMIKVKHDDGLMVDVIFPIRVQQGETLVWRVNIWTKFIPTRLFCWLVVKFIIVICQLEIFP